ncbi:MAG: DUF4190 domain-containing protein [Bradymonadaceae bacterium]|nr:DUF4190 domain-containing protein [Lujinxingiaceae bacterium]
MAVEDRPRRARPETSLGILSLLAGFAGLVSLFSCWIFPPLNFVLPIIGSITAIVLGIITLRRVGRGAMAETNKGLAIGGILAGIITPLFLVVLFAATWQELRVQEPPGQGVHDPNIGGGPQDDDSRMHRPNHEQADE